jgi:hypothetical protein
MTADISQLVEEICELLSTNDLVTPDRARDYAARYGAACEEVNRRLREAHLCLSRGLRSEAIQLCEEEPNLLDLVALLDLPPRSEFLELLSFADVAAPPRVAVELASELNDAYAAELPLKALLKQHRLLALQRASLADRIRVIRRILDLDASQAGWLDDLKSFEVARARGILEESRNAFLREDLGKLQSLLEELHADGWRSPPSQAICTEVQSKADDLAARCARADMVGLDARLNQAHSALDIHEARLLRARWLKLSQLARLGEDDPTRELVAPALEWLREEDERDQQSKLRDAAFRQLEQALEDGDTRESLDAAYREANRFDEGIAPLLENRYRQRLLEMDLAELRRRRMLTASIALGVLLVAGLTAYLVRAHRRADAIAESQAVLAGYMDAMELDEAVIYLEELPGEVRDSDIVRASVKDLERMVSNEKQRLRDFEAALKAFETSAVEQPDLASLGRADQLARLRSEKDRVKQLRSSAELAELERMNRDTKSYLNRLHAYTDEISSDDAIPEIRLRAIESDLEGLLEKYRHLTPALTAQGETLRTRIQAMRRRLAEANSREDLHKAVQEAIGDHEAYVSRLLELAEDEPDAGHQESLRKVIRDESKVWQAMAKWQQLAEQASWNSLAKVNCQDAPKMARELMEVSKLLEEQCEVAPEIREDMNAKQRMLQKVAGRYEGGSSPLDRLAQLSSNPLMSGTAGKGLWLIKSPESDGRPMRFYYSFKKPLLDGEEPRARASGVGIDYIKDVSTHATRRTVRSMDGLKVEVAPQTVLAEKMQGIVAELRRDDVRNGVWESRLSQLVEQIQKQPDLNDALRFLLMTQVIDIAGQGSSSLEAGYAPVLKTLRAAPVDISANWIDSEDPAAEEARVRAFGTLSRIREPLEQAKRTAAERFRAEVSPFEDRVRWVGWIALDADGRPEAQFTTTDVNGPVFLVSSDGGKATRLEVGTADQGAFSWKQAGDARLRYGRPLYARVSQEKAR